MNIPVGIIQQANNGGGGITLVGSIQTRSSTSVSLSSLSLEENDIVFVASTSDYKDTDLSLSGYTFVYEIINHEGLLNMVSATLQYKVMGSVPDTQITDLNSDSKCCHIVFAIRDADPVTYDATYAYNYSDRHLPDPPDVTTEYDKSWVFAGGHLDDDRISMTAPSGFTLVDAYYSVSAGAAVAVAYQLKSVAGEVSIGSFGGSGSDANIGASFAIRPKL